MSSQTDGINRRLSKKEFEATGKRYCTNCQSTQKPEGGEKKGTRWICAACVYRRENKIPNGKPK